MTELIDRGLFLLLGLAIGFILGRMTRSLVRVEKGIHHVEQIVERERDEGGFMQINRIITDLLYLLILGITLFGVVRAEKALNEAERAVDALAVKTAEDEVTRCQAGKDTREALRGIVDAIYTLATGNLQRSKDDPPLTDEEVLRYNAYIDRVNEFREDTYALIKPSELCAPHVDDDKIKPPTPPFPHVTN